MRIRKAVFPVAGLGTRFLPATKASPKEMLPVVDKPLIQYAVEEAINAGADPGSKYDKALALGIPVLDEQALLELLSKFD